MTNTLLTQRQQTVPIDCNSRQATGTTQWFLESGNAKKNHPITFNNQIKFFICGEEGFADIAGAINNAKTSIELICWGFDPGMELMRQGSTWPRGETYGDLLIRKAMEGVNVRLLVWYNEPSSSMFIKNMPGFSHGIDTISSDPFGLRSGQRRRPEQLMSANFTGSQFPRERQRAIYCTAWYDAARAGRIAHLEVRLRDGKSSVVAAALTLGDPHSDPSKEKYSSDLKEKTLLKYFSTHHQKPILIDYDQQNGESAVAYVMGLNSVTDYWDTKDHAIDDPRREVSEISDDRKEGYRHLKPYRDYACRVTGQALVWINKNFCDAWDQAGSGKPSLSAQRKEVPAALQGKARASDVSVQIVRTQPEAGDKSIKQLYYQVIPNALRYLYIENQYFYYQELAEHLIEAREKFAKSWKEGRGTSECMPVLHVFLIIPPPEDKGMIPRTYDTLAVLGQQHSLAGQHAEIEKQVEYAQGERSRVMNESKILAESARMSTGLPARPASASAPSALPLPRVVAHASTIHTPSIEELETLGLKVLTLTLASSGMVNQPSSPDKRMGYRDIYIHSKLMLIDDGFITVGSANINQRSMAVDSELNLATNSVREARALRQRIWSNLSDGKYDGGGGTEKEIAMTFEKWKALAQENADEKSLGKDMLKGFLIPLQDTRSCLSRVA